MTPYASVIVPTHHRPDTLPLAIASIQNQSVRNLEILIVGDGVDDDTRAIASGLATSDARIVFTDLPKGARSGTAYRDEAVLSARSPRIFYSDDDDLLLPDHVATLGAVLDDNDVAESLPASLSRSGRVELALVNHGHAAQRARLAELTLKLTFDTHIAHRREAYVASGRPWLSRQEGAAGPFLAALAANASLTWRTVPTITALSAHGAARHGMTRTERANELARAGFRLLSGTDVQASPACHLFLVHLMAPASFRQGGARAFLERLGVALDATERSDLIVPTLSAQGRQDVEDLFALMHPGSPVSGRTAALAIRLCEPILGGRPHAERIARILGARLAPQDLEHHLAASTDREPHDNEMAACLLALLQVQAHQPLEAARTLDGLAAGRVVHTAYVQELRSLARFDAREFEAALEHARNAIALEPRSRLAVNVLIRCLLARQEFEAAGQAIDQAGATFPGARFVDELRRRLAMSSQDGAGQLSSKDGASRSASER